MIGSGKISGHTGTSFRHRKGFALRKRHLRQLQASQSTVPDHGTYRARGGGERWEIVARLLAVVATLTILFLIGRPFWNTFVNYRTELATEPIYYGGISPAERMDAVVIMRREGYQYLAMEEWAAAERAFQVALRQVPDDPASNLGLAESLWQQCARAGQNCTLARQQMLFCTEKGW
ncbi:MAG: hypothetical protein AAGJ82_10035 [Bacteroidota bacterium]